MEDNHATKGVLITTSWVTKDGHAFATRHGRIEIMECEHVKYLCKEHLGLDVLISLPSHPRADLRQRTAEAAKANAHGADMVGLVV